MKRPPDALKFVLARDIEGRTELIEMYRHADTLWLVTEDEEVVVEPDKWQQIHDDLTARGFVVERSAFICRVVAWVARFKLQEREFQGRVTKTICSSLSP